MLPRLYEMSHDRDGNGYGFFNSCSRCDVTEERNGEYFAELEIQPDDRLVNRVVPNTIIKAKPNHYNRPQRFVVEKVERDKYGAAMVTAQHIKSYFMNNVTRPSWIANPDYKLSGTAYNVAEKIVQNTRLLRPSQDEYGSHFGYQPLKTEGFSSEVKTLDLDFSVPLTLNQVFNDDGGFLDTFGGEFYFDDDLCYLYANGYTDGHRGNTTNKVIRYGAEISDFIQTMSNAGNYTSVYSYAKFTDSDNIIRTVETDVIPTGSQITDFFFQKILPKDFSSHFSSKKYDPTTVQGRQEIEERLDYLTRKYVNARNSSLSDPSVNIRVTKNPELNTLQDVRLCDRVKVIYGTLGMTLTVKVVKTVYDSLRERYKEIELGERKLRLSDYIKKTRRLSK